MSDPLREHRCWAEINLAAIRHNVDAIRAHIGSGVRIMAVVKANAYGHGATAVTKTLDGRVEMFGVANVREAREVRAQLPGASVFILGPALEHERAEIAESGFVPAVSSVEEAATYSALGSGRRVAIHLAIDTGMGRIGVWQDEALSVASRIAELPGVEIAGIGTHLPVSDEDDVFTNEQLRRFDALTRAIGAKGVAAGPRHSHNSAGIIGFPAQCGEMVRAGLMLYGSAPRPEFQSRLRAVMTWKTRITLIRDVGPGRGISYGRTFIVSKPMRIATLAAGYADGYPRHLSNRGAEVLIRGHRCAVLGRVTMDQIMVDVTTLPSLAPGEEAVLIGRQGDEEILAVELAEKAGTIAWEIFTGVGQRVKRVYLE